MTPEVLISHLQGLGHRITRRQLKRWQAEDLIPRPKQRATKGIAGTQTFYREDTAHYLQAICQLRNGIRSFDRIRWALWRLGHPMPTKFWKPQLISAARRFDKFYRRLTDKSSNKGTDKEFKEIVEVALGQFSQRPINNPFVGIFKRNLGHSDFAIFLQSILEIPFRQIDFPHPITKADKSKLSKAELEYPANLLRTIFERAFRRPSKTNDPIFTIDNLGKEFSRISTAIRNQTTIAQLISRKPNADLCVAVSRSSFLILTASEQAKNSGDNRWNIVSTLRPDSAKLPVKAEAMLIVFWIVLMEDDDFKARTNEFFSEGPKS